MLIVNSPIVDETHENAGHPERPERLSAALAGISDLNLGDDVAFAAPYNATRAELYRVHDATDLEGLSAFCDEGDGALDADTYGRPTAARDLTQFLERNANVTLRSNSHTKESSRTSTSDSRDDVLSTVRE
jgi:acetoin utilization deacetylase AcuC-like enzyme